MKVNVTTTHEKGCHVCSLLAARVIHLATLSGHDANKMAEAKDSIHRASAIVAR